MPATDVTAWLQFAIQQMAAESYLNGFSFSDTDELIRRLKLGNNNNPLNGPNDPILPGNTRFVDLTGVPNANQVVGSAQAFAARYQIIDHHANDATGFSATLMRDTMTGEYTLSFRSLEYQNQVDGGDWERDGLPGAAGEIAGTGFALAQLVSMERYYRELKADPNNLPTGAILNVTGYSLGGHLATVFTQLHANDIAATYTFDGAGRGGINGGPSGLSETERIREMLQFAEYQILNWDPTGDVFHSGNGENIYNEQWYQGVRGQTIFQFQPTSSFLPSGQIGSAPGFEKITQLVGHATHNDQEYVANSGIHAQPTTIFIEDQPNVDGLGGLFGQSGGFGTTHSITLLVDSLALMELFQQVDGELEQATIERIFAAASSQIGSGVAGLAGLAEGNSLENALDALGKILAPSYTPTPFGRHTNDFGNLTFRNPFYANLEAVKAAVGIQTYQIASFAAKSSSEIYAAARQANATGLAYRYALTNLNPFAVIGPDYTNNNPGQPGDGPLELYDAQTGTGTWTALALIDRAELLTKRLAYNLSDGGSVPTDTHYVDLQTGFEVGSIASTKEVIFGDDRVGDVLIGHAGDDHLYGRDGADTIEGNDGRDYIEGGVGNDPLLSGGAGDDIILGQAGNDTLDGGADNDRLNGGLGDDRLEGGIGLDTYLSPDGRFTYVKQGLDLVINGTLTIKNFDFQTGALGIKLSDAGNLVDSTGPTINYNNGQPTITYDGDATDNTPRFTAAANHEAYGFGGNDILDLEVSSAAFNHQIFGGDGHDELHGGSGQDRIYGEAGRDFITGWVGDDVLDGGGDSDLIKGGLGQDVVLGGLGNDYLDGESDDDVVFGGDGNDVLTGEAVQQGATTIGDDYLDGEAGDDWVLGLRGDDVLYGGSGMDHLYGDQVSADTPNVFFQYPGIVIPLPGEAFNSMTGGADYLDGEEGDDYLQGDAGDDILFGGADNDE
ncbi:MAG: calcium-binding protein, partial [Nitrospirales bacterium]